MIPPGPYIAGAMQIVDALRLAIRHFNAGRADEGAALCGAILNAQPDNPVANCLLARARLRARAPEEARTLVDRALRAAPDYPAALELDAQLLDEAENGLPETVARAYRRALIAGPASGGLWFAYGNHQQGALDDAAGAVTFYRRALAVTPGDIPVAMNLATARLKLGDPEAALALCEDALARRPTHIRALALKSTALYDLGNPEPADALTGFGTLTRPMMLPVPEGYTSLDAFNAAFAAAIRNHPNRRDDYDPTKRAIRGGSLVTDLLQHDDPAIRGFRAALDAAVAVYRNALPDLPGHPHIDGRPRGYALDVWGNILRAQGHQDGHIHNLGWLSGVYYVEMPEVLSEADTDHQGWIEFNHPGYGIPDRGTATTHRVCPRPGMIVLFPSYVWHRTVPFDGGGERISVAFDLHPR
ncbi:putative 2OG-Fe(II) oxygenase [Thalassobaculum sp.]|uniref:putative 2OG-Fe(II) oxygenase n=1 Tax=Thalassobaculum sp. TaxID=2022740 RepID=UPI0032EBA53C